MIYDRIIQGDTLTELRNLPDACIDCVMTSPPYFALRDYGDAKQIGLEKTAEAFIARLVEVFDEVKRVLKPSGTCWVNIGDTYYGGGRNKNNHNPTVKSKSVRGLIHLGDTVLGPKGVDKCLAQIPSRFAIAMTDHGWILRNEIIWHKPNAMPSSIKDRFTVDFEKLYFFTKKKTYTFKTQYEPAINGKDNAYRMSLRQDKQYDSKAPYKENQPIPQYAHKRVKRSVWSIPTKPYTGSHFAVFPEALVETPLSAGCPEGGTVLDPFAGSGTTCAVALKQKKHYLGIELNPEYIRMAQERIATAQSTLI